jgi:prevent-host-death family protein
MSTYTVAEAKNKLSELINRALDGEGVVITRHGEPVVELKSVKRQPRRMTEADFEWLRAHRERLTPAKTDAGTLIRQMRDEEGER